MLRSFLIYLSKAAWARRAVTGWRFAWRAASRFVAGERLEDAIRVVRTLNEQGIYATLDHLGENTTNPEEADRALEDMLAILDVIDAAEVQANLSIKLTQIGLALDETACASRLRTVLERARAHDTFVRIDMEDSPYVEGTLRLYRQMRAQGLDNVGVVIQSYLYRSEADVRQLGELRTRIRLVKGAYKEPPEIAYPKKKDVDANYDRLTDLLLQQAIEAGAPLAREDGKVPPIPAIASHDERRIQFAKDRAAALGLPKRALEFQMLYGIRRELQQRLVAEGYPVRVYVPYGTEWYPYFMRRLAERPANLWFFLSNLFRK